MNQLKLIELHRFPPLCISVHIYIFIYFFILLWPKNKKNSFITETGLIRIAHQFFWVWEKRFPRNPGCTYAPIFILVTGITHRIPRWRWGWSWGWGWGW